MTRPKGKLFALLAIFAAIGLLTATGAFSTVEAQRTVNINVADDSNAVLQLEPSADNDGNGALASDNSSGQLTVQLDSSNTFGQSAEGVNGAAITTFDSVFNITNQGTQSVQVSITSVEGTNSDAITFYDNSDSSSSLGTQTLSTGSEMSVGIKVDTTASANGGTALGSGDSIDVTVTIDATEQ